MRKLLFLLVSCLFLNACVAGKSIHHRLHSADVEPVTTPTTYRYGPHKTDMVFSITASQGEASETMRLFFSTSATQDNDRLIWHTFVPKWEENGTVQSFGLPLLDAIWTTNLRGVEETCEVTFPLLESIPDSKEAREQLQKAKDQTIGSITPLPQTGIVTGQPLLQATKAAANLFGDNTKLALLLDGEFSLNGVRYVSASRKGKVGGNMALVKKDISAISYDMRLIMRKDTMETISGVMDFTIHDRLGQLLPKIKMTIETIAGQS